MHPKGLSDFGQQVGSRETFLERCWGGGFGGPQDRMPLGILREMGMREGQVSLLQWETEAPLELR